MAVADCREQLLLYGHSGKTRPNLSLPAICENFENTLFSKKTRAERVGIINLVDKAKVPVAMIYVGMAVLVTLWKEIAIKLWSSPFLLKEGNTSRDDNESVLSEILRKGYLLFVAILRGFRLRNSKRGVALVMALLVVSNLLVSSTAVATTTGKTSPADEDDPIIGDRGPSNCRPVHVL